MRSAIAAFALLAMPATWSQLMVSARSGMIHHVEGNVTMAGEQVVIPTGSFPEVNVGQTLETGAGRAEVLLTPGVFLRMDENSSFKMISNQLTDTQVQLVTGSALVEVDELLKDNHIAVRVGESETTLLKNGLYHFNADSGQIRVFDGKAEVSVGSTSVELTKGRTVILASAMTVDKFNTKAAKTDGLYAWSLHRAGELSVANSYAASQVPNGTYRTSLWAYDPWLNMYTFLPRWGLIDSPFGQVWYSPSTIWINTVQTYVVQTTGVSSGGGNSTTSSGLVTSSAPSASSAISGGGARSSGGSAAVPAPSGARGR